MTGPSPALLEGEADPRPVVAMPREGLPAAVIGALAVILALALFWWIESARSERLANARRGAAQAAIVAPPPLALPAQNPVLAAPAALPPPPANPQPFPPVVLQRQAPPTTRLAPATGAPPVRLPPIPPMAQPQTLRAAPDEPALVIDGGATLPPPSKTAASANPADQAIAPPARPRRITNPTMVVPVGTLIAAALETPIDTARPGMVRAVVSRDTRGFDGRKVLIGRGSRLIGDYQADVRSGQNRVLVTWNTLVLPNGTQIDLKSPGADPLGGAGVPGKVHSFFLERFGTSLLQTAMNVGSNLALRSIGDGSVVLALPVGQSGTMLGQDLFPADGYKPKITVQQGAAIKVFVARDLDFSEILTPAPTAGR